MLQQERIPEIDNRLAEESAYTTEEAAILRYHEQ